MFARVFALLPLALLASATHLAARDQENSCNGGTQACCSQSFTQTIPSDSMLDGITAIVNAANQVGVTCTAFTVETCNQQQMCCDQNDEHNFISVSCNNINGF